MSAAEMYASLIGTMASQIAEARNKANGFADQIIHAGNVNVLIAEVRDNSEDESIVAFRTWLEQVEEAIAQKQKAVDEYIVSSGLVDTTPVDIASATEQYKVQAAMAKQFLGAILAIPGVTPEDLPSLPELKSIPGQRTARMGASAGTPKPRIASVVVNGTEVREDVKDPKDASKTRSVSNFSTLAKFLAKATDTKVEVSDLHAAAFAEAKTNDLASLNGAPIHFIHTIGDKHFEITIIPQVKSNKAE